MSLTQFLGECWQQMKETTVLEYIAVLTGIASTYFSKKASIWLYPLGIVSTVMYVFISFEGRLFAEGGLNVYYAAMNVIGWRMWCRKKMAKDNLQIGYNTRRDWVQSVLFFAVMYLALWLVLKNFTPSTVPQADALASSTAYTAMFLMNRKKIESWYWWIFTDIISIPLYYSKGYVFTGFQFLVFLILCVSGWKEWREKYSKQKYSIDNA